MPRFAYQSSGKRKGYFDPVSRRGGFKRRMIVTPGSFNARSPYLKKAYRNLYRSGLISSKVNSLYKMIETKELSHKTGSNIGIQHNNTLSLQRSDGLALNIFYSSQNADDPMTQNTGSRIGDQFNVRGVMIRAFFENALHRSKVYYRIMVLRGAKGETFSRGNIFKGDSDNKMIDQVNTERFTIVAQKVFTINCASQAPTLVDTSGQVTAGNAAGIGTRTIKMWIPGRKFGPRGKVQFENGSLSQVKFYDYRIVVLAYDWFGTPQDINIVGRINELYTKCYFKDA